MQLSIVIPAWNEEKLLPATLSAIRSAAEAAFPPAGITWELIVSNNNSSDRTAEIAEAGGARVVFEPVNQIGRARNTGAAAAQGEWILFVDADSEPSPALFRDLAAALQNPSILGGGSLLRMETDHPAGRMILKLWSFISRQLKYAAGSFLFVRTSAFRESGGFDPAFFAAEELDLSKRLKKIARRERQRFVILTNHPMETSARKLSMHSASTHLLFMLRTTLTGGRTLKRKESCAIWYDGQR